MFHIQKVFFRDCVTHQRFSPLLQPNHAQVCIYRYFVVCINYIRFSKRYEFNYGYLLSGFPSSFLLLPSLLPSLFPKKLSFLSVIPSSALTSESCDFRCIPSCLHATRVDLFVIWFYLDRISFLRSDQPLACCNPVTLGSLVVLEIQMGILTTGKFESQNGITSYPENVCQCEF